MKHFSHLYLFTPALFFPPFSSRIPPAWAQGAENIGSHWFPQFSGVLIIEACKKIYAVPRPEKATIRREVALGVSERIRLEHKEKAGLFSEPLKKFTRHR